MGYFSSKRLALPFDDMLRLHLEGVVGTKEMRNWLSEVDPAFEKVRDTSVDDQIDEVARERAQILRDMYDPPERPATEDEDPDTAQRGA